MILKRQEKDGIVKAMYDSSNIVASIYNNETSDLEIIFKAGTKYKYPNVSKSDYMRFEIAESQGAVFNTHIKKYTYEKMANVDVSKILLETEALKVDEDKALKEGAILKLVEKIKYLANLADKDNRDVLIDYMEKFNTESTELLTLIKK
jgi:hypothetical protein